MILSAKKKWYPSSRTIPNLNPEYDDLYYQYWLKNDFGFFVNEYLNYLEWAGADLVELAPFHIEMIENLPIQPRQLYELFRGAAKTEIPGQAYVIFHALQNNRLIVLSGAKEDQPKQVLRNIKRIIKGWDAVSHLYEGSETWAKTEAELSNGTQIFVKSMLSDWRGLKNEILRPTLVILDDPIPDRLQLPLKFYVDFIFDSIIPAISQDGQLIVCGTPIHLDDVVMQLRHNPAYYKMRVPVWDENENPSWPQKYNKEWIQAKRDEMFGQPIQFAKNYLLVLIELQSGFFSMDWITKNYVIDDWSPDRDSRRVLAIDPAIKKEEVTDKSGDTDYFAMCVMDYFYRVGLWKTLDTFHDRLTWVKQIEQVKLHSALWNPSYVVVESNFYQTALGQQLIRETTLPIWQYDQTDDKIERITELAPYLRNGVIKFTRKAVDDEFKFEYKMFPHSDKKKVKKDKLDAFQLAFKFSRDFGGHGDVLVAF